MLKRLLLAGFLAMLAGSAQAAGTTAWICGNIVGACPNYTGASLAFASGDMTSLANGSAVMSSNSAYANGVTNADQFAMISASFTVASATPPAGAWIGIFIMPLSADGSTYGTAEIAAAGGSGNAITHQPAGGLACTIPLETSVATTVFAGTCGPFPLPEANFKIAVYNGSGAALSSTAANNIIAIFGVNQNLNH